MQHNQNSKLLHEPTPAELAWASEMLKDIFCGCLLNMKLKRAGLCPKYIYEMEQAGDYRKYGAVLEDLLFKKT
jgi:hypothetical protein